ncbi:GNAT family N-acetyltransferase [Amniculibacterium sp. G2-70]|uniref:GNAT family N-acetyltransferase n=1 Tax=Amniculibacterium sp. G2-70 TaxID=2767188 RepID=UPI0016549A18|nr:GNAT family N-acetyltransferase [Amniculibacterium sp. G2-70]
MKKNSIPQTVNSYEIRTMEYNDLGRVLEIYQEGISSKIATFQEQSDEKSWMKIHLEHSRFVLENQNDEIVGWCALKKPENTTMYNGVAEISIFLEKEYQGKGLGKILLEKLILDSEENGIWTLQTHLMEENVLAIKIVEKFGFRKVGKREKINQIDGVWKDVFLFERRSEKDFS